MGLYHFLFAHDFKVDIGVSCTVKKIGLVTTLTKREGGGGEEVGGNGHLLCPLLRHLPPGGGHPRHVTHTRLTRRAPSYPRASPDPCGRPRHAPLPPSAPGDPTFTKGAPRNPLPPYLTPGVTCDLPGDVGWGRWQGQEKAACTTPSTTQLLTPEPQCTCLPLPLHSFITLYKRILTFFLCRVRDEGRSPLPRGTTYF